MPKRYKGYRHANRGKNVYKKRAKSFQDKKPSHYLHRKSNADNVPSLRTETTGACNWKKDKPQDAKEFPIAPAYNKGAYQLVTSLENAKDVGK